MFLFSNPCYAKDIKSELTKSFWINFTHQTFFLGFFKFYC